MCILDRYILRSVLAFFLICLCTFLFLYVVIDIVSHLDEILKQKASLDALILYYLSYLPIIFVNVAPFACLLSTLYTLGRLNRDNEIIAMRSSGLSILQITKTVLIFGALVSVFIFWVGDRLLPQSLTLTERMKDTLETGRKRIQDIKREDIANLSIYGLKNRLFFINKFSPSTNTMEGIVILEHDDSQNITKKIVANKGEYKDDLWRFYQCITHEFDENGQMKGEPIYLQEEIMTIPETPEEFLNQRQRPDFMTIAQIDEYIWKLSRSGATGVIRNLKVDYYHRFTGPFTSIIILILGIPFAFKMKRRATGLSSLGLSIMMGFLYYVLTTVSLALGKAGFIPPLPAAFLPHLVAFFSGLYMITSLP